MHEINANLREYRRSVALYGPGTTLFVRHGLI